MSRNSVSIIKKLRSKAGLSMVETLATVVLVGLMGIVVATGVNTVHRTYEQIVTKANEQTLLSTTIIELRNELRYSVDVDLVSDTDIVKRIQSEKGYWLSYENDEDGNGGIRVNYYSDKDATDPIKSTYLVAKANGDISNVYSSYEGDITYEDGKFTISGLKVGDTELEDDYIIARITN